MSRTRSLTVAIAVAAVVLAFALGIPLLNKAVSPTVDVGGETFTLQGVTLTAPAAVRMRPGYYQPESGRVEFLVGDAEVDIVVAGPYGFDAEYLADEMARLLEAQPGVHLTDPRDCAADGVQGAGRSFVTETGAGFACAFVHDDVRAEVTATGSSLDSATVDRIDALIAQLSFEAA
ncbi:hypothetical protein K3N28_16790 [Glycomyces sp. TRM65418]|uniref:hypothetical protein n=1 Tax=Glycomyces sp. TRM65418 TaxID=2867006 RepID=UPI001CE66062|nr:hypothetical protein [Glycomyces sp. TRM65418]MCC3764716.1 hypothetical protein [Glycomyces sp. TRM65418]QZD54375.1 hypothetical protein K3N28_16705 [Glycomyces sp. TRM65418]